jgi:hypothetical protein
MSSATASTEAALNSFATLSLKPLLRFIATECVASMPPTDSSIVDYVIKLLITNKEHLEQASRMGADRPPLLSAVPVTKVASHVVAATQVSQERSDSNITQSTDANSSLPTPVVKAGASALCDLARDRVDKGFQRRDYHFLHDV